ncbi:HisM ABC-type amino acid transport system, permease component [Rhabdaerophilaceae bacterium]
MTRLTRLALVLTLPLLLAGCASSAYTWGWYVVMPTTPRGTSNMMFLLGGMALTIQLSIVSIVLSVLLGLVVAMIGLTGSRIGRYFNVAYVEIFRSVPMLIMILWVYYGLPVLLGISLNPFIAGVIALVLCDSAFEAEIFRAGIQSIHKGQTEASDSLGLSYADKMRFVVLPQAIRRILPPLGNQFVYMLKASSLVSVIGLMELTRRANELTVVEYRPLEIYTALLLEYLLLILIVSYFVRRLEKHLRVD